MQVLSPQERIQGAPAPRRQVSEWDENWNRLPNPVCPVCRREVSELLPYGLMGKRFACADCIARRHSQMERRATILASPRSKLLARPPRLTY
jgi:hypothetical protein